MNTETIITGEKLFKKYKGFELSIPYLQIPKGFATALIGENGAGKTTLLNMMAGVKQDFIGEFTYFGEEKDVDADGIRERIGYTSPKGYFLSQWSIKQVRELTAMLFEKFSEKRFDEICDAINLPSDKKVTVRKLSDGNKMKLMLATVFARETDILILDEPASPLDPLMRDRLCEMIRSYINAGNGEKSVFFSTHNIADMENVTDYAIIMDKGRVVEEGFVEELKEKYILVKGEKEDFDKVAQYLISGSIGQYGFEGLADTSQMERFAGLQLAYETPNLSQISVGIMKKYSELKAVV